MTDTKTKSTIDTKLLSDHLKAISLRYLGLPYFQNSITNPNQSINATVGKGNFQEIALHTIKLAQDQKIDLTKFSDKEIYAFQKKNKIGIDCSGLVYQILNEALQKIQSINLDDLLIGTGNKKGVRRLSANLLTSKPNAVKVENFNDIQAGDLIRVNQGQHVILILEKTGDKINYIHNSRKTQIRGVHLGQITITDPHKNLEDQKFSDFTLDNKDYTTLINTKKGDGIYRLKILN